MDNHWFALLQWLQLLSVPVEARETPEAGIGLFSLAPIPPSTPLFTIPARALLNSRSLSPHYPPGLNAVQLISLHLCLYRHSPSLDPLFGPYLSTLPREFDTHPLTSQLRGADPEELPPSVANALQRLHERYLRDWTAVRAYLRNNSAALSQKPDVRTDDVLHADFLWAWLNVNTRCVYHRLKRTRADADNFTLCPILDFANHIATGPCMTPRTSPSELANAPPIPRLGDPLTLLSPRTPVGPGEELYLTYGAHPNRTLFVEYGFVVPCGEDDARAQVDVQDLVDQLFAAMGEDGKMKREMLRDAGYWGDWTLDGSPAVSFRLITALRLLYCGSDDEFDWWRNTLTGVREMVSPDNERAWKASVGVICETLIRRAQERRTRPVASGWLTGAVEALWEEEYRVALHWIN
ncbi:hypothetical protein DFH07DRAFT_952355 [Mycena maculata]|uniref:SET domain-containing protein n=1 Tax=Mycena maculata TaxID=230809 RepID=A0AAD7K0Y7_9AGAR|nr:hypothetical protein DFH07DRAFT_952355 [Mycena maculata]